MESNRKVELLPMLPIPEFGDSRIKVAMNENNIRHLKNIKTIANSTEDKEDPKIAWGEIIVDILAYLTEMGL